MPKYLRISVGNDPDNLLDIFPAQEVGRFSWEDPGDGGVTVSAAPAGEVGAAGGGGAAVPRGAARPGPGLGSIIGSALAARGGGGGGGGGGTVFSEGGEERLKAKAQELAQKSRDAADRARANAEADEAARQQERRREPEGGGLPPMDPTVEPDA